VELFVPSKNRHDGKTLLALERYKMKYNLVIEKGDYELYKSLQYANIIILPKANKGIGYSRNYIVSIAKAPFLMLDDDLNVFYYRNRKLELVKVSIKRFIEVFSKYCNKPALQHIPIIGCKNTTFALPDNDFTYNTDVAHIVYVNPNSLAKMKLNYDVNLRAFEDIDLLIRILLNKVPEGQVVRINKLVYYTTPSGTNTGGLDYTKVDKEHFLNVLVKKYPSIIENLKSHTKYNQPKYTVHWDRIEKQ